MNSTSMADDTLVVSDRTTQLVFNGQALSRPIERPVDKRMKAGLLRGSPA